MRTTFTITLTFKPNSLRNSVRFAAAMLRIRSLAPTLATLVREGNERGILAGTDAEGRRMAPVSPRTKRPGNGPPLAPRSGASRVIQNFRVVPKVTLTGIRFQCYWVDADWMRFHVTGTRYMPRRNPAGLRPEDERKFNDAIDKHFSKSANYTMRIT